MFQRISLNKISLVFYWLLPWMKVTLINRFLNILLWKNLYKFCITHRESTLAKGWVMAIHTLVSFSEIRNQCLGVFSNATYNSTMDWVHWIFYFIYICFKFVNLIEYETVFINWRKTTLRLQRKYNFNKVSILTKTFKSYNVNHVYY